MKIKIVIVAGVFLLVGLWLALTGKDESQPTHGNTGNKISAAQKETPGFPHPPAVERIVAPKDGRPMKKMPGLKRVEPPRTASRGEMNVRKKGPPDREELRYIVTVFSDEPANSARSIQTLLKGFGTEQTIDPSAPNKVAVPRKEYRPFIQGLKKLGRLDVQREAYKAPNKGPVPIPFEIRLKLDKPENNGKNSQGAPPGNPNEADAPQKGPANEFGE